VKRYFRQRCLESASSGVGFGLCCVGSTIGLMVLWLALGAMSLAWMSVVAVVVLVQKLWPANLAIDVPLALAIVGLGIWIIVAQTAPL
jgi:predicted metal-binding membrane protein